MSIKKGHSKEEAAKPRFVAPDGGWGWMIVVAAGFSNFCTFGVLICFGLIFRDRFEQLGINSSQTSTILNVNCAVTSCIGLANGPLFRIYSYRQVSLAGALICSVSICVLSYVETFGAVLAVFSIMYGAGAGLAMSAGTLALNTYFEKRRRIAVGLAWTVTGVGPMISPQIVALLMPIYGATGTCLLFGGFTFNAVACALLMQPVDVHARKESESGGIEATADAESTKDSSNDGLLGKNNEVNDPVRRVSNLENAVAVKSIADESCEDKNSKDENEDARDLISGGKNSSEIRRKIAEERVRLSWHRRFFRGTIVFFDLDLLRDFVYVNLMTGVNISNFAEFNFIFLSPYIFFAYRLTESRVAAAMSVIAAVDLVGRVTIPFVAARFGLQNKTYFLIGIGIAAIGRLVLAHVESYSVIMTLSVLMGIGRALTIIFQALVIPTHVPLERLPAALGIQMMTGGLIFLTLGPIVGWIRDTSGNYTSVLHFLNLLSVLTIVSWTLQAWCCSGKRQRFRNDEAPF